MDDLLSEFLVEGEECLDRMERCLTQWEARPDDTELLAEIFRSVHTIKGATGFLALPRLEQLAHAGEHLLGILRDRKAHPTRPVIDGLLALLDALRSRFRAAESTGADDPANAEADTPLIQTLAALARTHALPAQQTDAPVTGLAALAPLDENSDRSSSAEHTLRVDVETLHRMMNLVGELVLTRNQVLGSNLDDEQFRRVSRRLDAVTSDLRETVMRARTQPVRQLFGKFPRMVRDVAQSCGRRVRLECTGEETRLDKSLLESLKDPITHAVRNAIDHGIESPADRLRAGKPVEGTLRLHAQHQGGEVVIEVSDDGGGIDADYVCRRAVERGLITAERARNLTREEALHLLFTPGFSTRTEVTLVSGRGVGLDVVHANVESAGGTVELHSRPGEGTTLRMRVPLTLAIVPALVVRCGGTCFALPQSALAELIVVPRAEEAGLIHHLGDSRLLRHREELLPLLSLSDLLDLRPDVDRGYYVAVVGTKDRRFGLIIDDLLDPQEIVVKPLARILRNSGVFSGASVLGSGELALILDIAGLESLAQLNTQAAASPPARLSTSPETSDATTRKSTPMLVYENHRGERTALPLSSVERIEQIPRSSIEFCEGLPLLQYRGHLLRLEDLGNSLQHQGDDSTVTLIICQRRTGTRLGIVIRRVLDIAHGDSEISEAAGEPHLTLVNRKLATLHSSSDDLALEHAA